MTNQGEGHSAEAACSMSKLSNFVTLKYFVPLSGLYCSGDWKVSGGWKYHTSKPATMPYEESYPKKNPKWERGEAWMYADHVR